MELDAVGCGRVAQPEIGVLPAAAAGAEPLIHHGRHVLIGAPLAGDLRLLLHHREQPQVHDEDAHEQPDVQRLHLKNSSTRGVILFSYGFVSFVSDLGNINGSLPSKLIKGGRIRYRLRIGGYLAFCYLLENLLHMCDKRRHKYDRV